MSTDALASYFLATCNLEKGQRVMLVFLPGLAFTAALIACFKAGIVAVPVFPPDPTRLGKELLHFSTIQKDCDAKVAITHASYNYAKKLSDVSGMFSFAKKNVAWPELRWITVDSVLAEGKSLAQRSISTRIKAKLNPQSDLAFLQYTSGSTSDPKGVMVSHQNLAHNLSFQNTEWSAKCEGSFVSWLPQYHDMGLIGSYFSMLYSGGTGYYLSPIAFLKNPLVWLQVMSNVKAYGTAVRKLVIDSLMLKLSKVNLIYSFILT